MWYLSHHGDWINLSLLTVWRVEPALRGKGWWRIMGWAEVGHDGEGLKRPIMLDEFPSEKEARAIEERILESLNSGLRVVTTA